METEKSTAIVVTKASSGPQRAIPDDQDNSNILRDDFPDDFAFGVGTAAFQVEGAAATDGKGPSVWDDFTLRTPAKIIDGSNGNVSADMYHRYMDDIRTMKRMGFDVYRFSISWPRILPGGRSSAGINRKGIEYYNDIIDTVIANGLEPYVTLFHFDLPDCLEKEYGGLLNKQKFVQDFLEYSELCFWEFGDRVKFWTTLNEPWTVTVNGYARGTFPPGKVASPPERVLRKLPAYRSIQLPSATVPTTRNYSDVKFDKSDPAKDAYIVGRNLLVAHATVVKSYRRKFQPHQGGQIGIVFNSNWFVPLNPDSEEDKAACKRGVDFMLGWFLEPVLYGTYPDNMKKYVPADNLAPFTHAEAEMLKGSTDYVGLNFYTAMYAANDPNPDGFGYDADQQVLFSHFDKDGNPIGGDCGSTWLYICPWSVYDHLIYLRDTYPDIPPIYITENGVSNKNDITITAKEACSDFQRIKYHQDHLANILLAINGTDEQKPVNVKGYIVWSWCDNFEWTEGYTQRFGIIHVDYLNNQTRYPKDSAVWFCKFLKSKKKLLKSSNKRQLENGTENNDVPEKRLRT